MLFNSHSHRIQMGNFDDTILRLPLLGGEDTKTVEPWSYHVTHNYIKILKNSIYIYIYIYIFLSLT